MKVGVKGDNDASLKTTLVHYLGIFGRSIPYFANVNGINT